MNQPESCGKWLGGPLFSPGPTCAAAVFLASPASVVVSLVSLDEHLDLHPAADSRRNSRKTLFDPLQTLNVQEKGGSVLAEKNKTKPHQIVKWLDIHCRF